LTPKGEKRKLQFLTPVSKRLDSKLERDRGLETARERERDRGRDRDSELMPPPGSQKKKSLPAPTDVDRPIDPNEPTYCICGQVWIKGIHS
jgi:inhibitor of growth protein 4